MKNNIQREITNIYSKNFWQKYYSATCINAEFVLHTEHIMFPLQWTLYRKTAVYCKNHMAYKNTFSGQNAETFNVKPHGICGIQQGLKG
jgi:hypothetical protein